MQRHVVGAAAPTVGGLVTFRSSVFVRCFCEAGAVSAISKDPGDELISARVAAEIVGVDRPTMYRLMAKGRIPTSGGPHAVNQIRRRDAEELRDRGEPIALSEAARILKRPIGFVRDLVARGELSSWEGSRRPVFRGEVERYAADLPDTVWPTWEGRLSTGAVAERLNRSRMTVYRLARAGLLPAVQDSAGRLWIDEHHLDMYLRARQFEAEADKRDQLSGM